MGGIIYLDLSPTIVGPDKGTGGDLAERRCVRIEDDQSQRSRCPGGGMDILSAILKALRFDIPVPSSDGIYRTLVRTQDDGQGYGLSISNGTMTSERLQERFDEIVELNPGDAVASAEPGYSWEVDLQRKLQWRPDLILSVSFSGSVLDSKGDPSPRPSYRVSGTKLLISFRVIADLEVSYKATTDANMVEVDTEGSGSAQSQLLVRSECGGMARFEINIPRCFDYSGIGDDIFDNGGDVAEEEEIGGADLYIDIDLCTGEREERIVPK